MISSLPIRILLVEDHQIVRQGLSVLLAASPDLDVVGEASDGRSAIRMAKELDPDVVLMDVALPGLNGIEATRQILAESNHVKVLGLSMHPDRRFVARMLKAGATGYVLKSTAFEELVSAVQRIAAGEIYLGPEVTGLVVKDYIARLDQDDPIVDSALSARQREVLQLLAEGNSTREIAATLRISIKTAEAHRKQLMDKLELRTVAELTKYAVREGLTDLKS